MAIIGKLYMASDNVFGLFKKDLQELIIKSPILVVDRYSSEEGTTVQYILGERKMYLEETMFHFYFILIEEALK